MKRTAIKRKSKTPLAKAKLKLWSTLKQLLNIRDGDTCISCGVTGLVGHNKHGGHFIPSSSCGGYLRYDIRNVHIQCSTCNLFRNGAGAEYTRSLEKKYSTQFVDKIIADKQVTLQLSVQYVEALTEYYESLLSKTQKQLISLTKKYNGFKLD